MASYSVTDKTPGPGEFSSWGRIAWESVGIKPLVSLEMVISLRCQPLTNLRCDWTIRGPVEFRVMEPD